MIIKQLSQHSYEKISTDVDRRQLVNTIVTGTFTGLLPFIATEQRQVTTYEYSAGKLKLTHKPLSAQSVVIYSNNDLLINYDSNLTSQIPQFRVINEYVVFRNNAEAYGTIVTGLNETVSEGDILSIVYQYSLEQKYSSWTFSITADDYDAGYVELDKSTAFPEHCVAYMSNGHILLNAYHSFITSSKPDYVVASNKFIFRNNVDIEYFTSANLSEFLQIDDIVTLIMCF